MFFTVLLLLIIFWYLTTKWRCMLGGYKDPGGIILLMSLHYSKRLDVNNGTFAKGPNRLDDSQDGISIVSVTGLINK